jgi:hypothetical protein
MNYKAMLQRAEEIQDVLPLSCVECVEGGDHCVGFRAAEERRRSVPKPSYEHDHLDKEYKGRNGVPGRVSEPDGFGTFTPDAWGVNPLISVEGVSRD